MAFSVLHKNASNILAKKRIVFCDTKIYNVITVTQKGGAQGVIER